MIYDCRVRCLVSLADSSLFPTFIKAQIGVQKSNVGRGVEHQIGR